MKRRIKKSPWRLFFPLFFSIFWKLFASRTNVYSLLSLKYISYNVIHRFIHCFSSLLLRRRRKTWWNPETKDETVGSCNDSLFSFSSVVLPVLFSFFLSSFLFLLLLIIPPSHLISTLCPSTLHHLYSFFSGRTLSAETHRETGSDHHQVSYDVCAANFVQPTFPFLFFFPSLIPCVLPDGNNS